MHVDGGEGDVEAGDLHGVVEAAGLQDQPEEGQAPLQHLGQGVAHLPGIRWSQVMPGDAR